MMFATIATARETDLLAGEIWDLIQQAKNSDHTLVNELGMIRIHNECPEAEKALVKLLDIGDTKTRFIAYCQLLRATGLSQHTQIVLQEFVQKFANEDIVEAAKKHLWLHLH